jgi:hypothetical protein
MEAGLWIARLFWDAASVGGGILEHMFDGMADGDLIEVMGKATRDESTAIAVRLAAVAELFVGRNGARPEAEWRVVDHCAAVAAEIAPVQHISTPGA